MLVRHRNGAAGALALALVLAMLPLGVATALGSPSDAGPGKPEAHCHDLRFPNLTCYPTEAERDLAFADASDGVDSLGELGVLASGGYVIAYLHASYAGSSVILTQDHGDLAFIGWGDRISSYKVYTSPTGYFHEGYWYSQRAQAFCCFTNVPYVGDALNDTFSSLNLP